MSYYPARPSDHLASQALSKPPMLIMVLTAGQSAVPIPYPYLQRQTNPFVLMLSAPNDLAQLSPVCVPLSLLLFPPSTCFSEQILFSFLRISL